MTVPAKLPKNEAARIEALHRYAILDTDPNREFDRIVKLPRVNSMCQSRWCPLSMKIVNGPIGR